MIGEDYERYCFQIVKMMRKMQNSYTRSSVTIKCQNESEQHIVNYDRTTTIEKIKENCGLTGTSMYYAGHRLDDDIQLYEIAWNNFEEWIPLESQQNG